MKGGDGDGGATRGARQRTRDDVTGDLQRATYYGVGRDDRPNHIALYRMAATWVFRAVPRRNSRDLQRATSIGRLTTRYGGERRLIFCLGNAMVAPRR